MGDLLSLLLNTQHRYLHIGTSEQALNRAGLWLELTVLRPGVVHITDIFIRLKRGFS